MESQNKNKPITFFSFDSNVLAHGIGFNMTLQKKKRHPSNGDFAAYGVHRHCWVCNPTNIHKIQWFTIRCGGKEYRSIGLSERGKMPYSIILGTTEGQSYTIFSELQRINDAKTMEKFDIYLSPKRKTLAPPRAKWFIFCTLHTQTLLPDKIERTSPIMHTQPCMCAIIINKEFR